MGDFVGNAKSPSVGVVIFVDTYDGYIAISDKNSRTIFAEISQLDLYAQVSSDLA